jgi:transcriptional regulator with XRE-family HTH domain
MDALREYMQREGISQAELARRVGVQQPTVWEWLHGKSRPRAKHLVVLSEKTGLSVDDLLKENAA